MVRRTLALFSFALALASRPAAAASPKEECIAASDRAQDLRDEGRYQLAREKLLACARESCPGPLRHDCSEWLVQLDKLMPSVVLSVRDAQGADVPNAEVKIDGAQAAVSLDGRPIPVDPGEHVFRASAGGRPLGERFLRVRSGEQGRLVDIRTGGTAHDVAQATAVVAAEPKPESGAAVPAMWGLGSLSAAALGAFIVLGVTGSNEAAALRGDVCAKTATCSSSTVSQIHVKLVAADIALGVAVLAAGTDAWLVGAHLSRSHRGPAVGIVPTGAGVAAQLRIPLD